MDPDCFARYSGGSTSTSPIPNSAAPWYCFYQPRDPAPNGFKVGMLLAAEDQRRQYDDHLIASPAIVIDVCGFRICCKFLKSNTKFWCPIDDELIHPLSEYVVSTNSLPRSFKRLCAPVDYLGGSPGSFEMHLPALLEGVHASKDLFLPKPEKPSRNMFQVGQRLEAVDPRHKDQGVFEAEIAEVIGDKVKIHFIGYEDDKTVKCDSRDLFPVGFTAKTGQPVRCGPKGNGADGPSISRNRPVAKRVPLKSEEYDSSNDLHFVEIMANVIAQSTTSSAALKRAPDEYREDHCYVAKKCKKAERVNEPLVDLLTGEPIVAFKVPLPPPVKRPRGRPRKIVGAGTPASAGTKPAAGLAAFAQSASIPLAIPSTSRNDTKQSSKFSDKPNAEAVSSASISASQKQPELSQLINAFRNSAAAALISPVEKEHVAISSTPRSINNVSTASGTAAECAPFAAVSSKQPPPLVDPRSGTIIVEPQNFRCVFYVNHDSLCNLGPFLSRSSVDRMPFIFGPSCVSVVMPALYQALMNAVTDKHRAEVLTLLPSVKIIGTSTINVACEHLKLALHHHLPFYDDNESAAEGLAATLKKLGCCENFISNRPDLKCGVGEDNVHYHYSILEPLK